MFLLGVLHADRRIEAATLGDRRGWGRESMSTSEAHAKSISQRAMALLAGVVTLVALFLISRSNYLLFHTLAELFSIIIGCASFLPIRRRRRWDEPSPHHKQRRHLYLCVRERMVFQRRRIELRLPQTKLAEHMEYVRVARRSRCGLRRRPKHRRRGGVWSFPL